MPFDLRNPKDWLKVERNMLVAKMIHREDGRSAVDKLETLAISQYARGDYLEFVSTMQYVYGYHAFFGEPVDAILALRIARSGMLRKYKEHLSGFRRLNGWRMIPVRYAMIVAWQSFADALMAFGLVDKALTQQRVLLRIIERSRGARRVGDVADVKRHLLRLEVEADSARGMQG
jgi:hypothetical protein